MSTTERERYEARVDRSGGPGACHPWTGAQQTRGYGSISNGRSSQLAHRLGWRLHHGTDPGPLVVRHTCDNKLCQNPEHWVLGTHADNSADMVERGRSARRFTDDDVVHWQRLIAEGHTRISIVREYGVSRAQLGRLLAGRR